MPSARVFLSKEDQQFYSVVLLPIIACSMLLHATSLVFLVQFTPRNQRTWRNYMLFIQVWLAALDMHLEVLVRPIPLFPVLGGYTLGLLCELGLPTHVQAGIGVIIIPNAGAAITLCVLHKHQSILVGCSQFRLSQIANRIIHVLLIVLFSVPGAFLCLIGNDQRTTNELIRKDPRNLTWIMERGCYIYLQRGVVVTILFVMVFTAIIIITILLASMFIHMIFILNNDKHKSSSQTLSKIRKSVARLFIQLFTPLVLVVLPVTIIVIAMASDDEQCLAVFSMTYLHSIAHSLLLIFITPTYRRKIVHVFKCGRGRNISKARNISVSQATNISYFK